MNSPRLGETMGDTSSEKDLLGVLSRAIASYPQSELFGLAESQRAPIGVRENPPTTTASNISP